MILKEYQQMLEVVEYYPKSDTYIMMRYEMQEHGISGEFRHLYMEEGQTFHSFSEFIYKLQIFLEDIGSPQMTTCRCRTWKKVGQHRNVKTQDKKNGSIEKPKLLKEASMKELSKEGKHFILHIRFCQNATWQGSIQWMDTKQVMAFRSVLELLMVLEETLTIS